MPKTFFKDTDKGYSKLMKSFQDTFKSGKQNNTVFVGVLRSAGEYITVKDQLKLTGTVKPITVAQVAAIQEFGTTDETIPERSYMRSTIDSEAKNIEKTCKNLFNKVLNSEITVQKALGTLGEYVKNKIKDRIKNQGPGLSGKAWLGLAKSTIARKGSTKMLIDTGQLINSIEWELRNEKK